MRARRSVCLAACLTLGSFGLSGGAWAEPGGFFQSLVGGSRGTGETMPSGNGGGPRLYDPDAPDCPTVAVRDGGAALQAYAGSVGDGSRLRHQIGFARLSRACTPRPDGTVSVKVGVELRGLLGPAGASGTLDAPVTITIRGGDRTLDTRTRRVAIAVPSGAAQGTATVIEDGLIVPAAQADNFDIEVALVGAPSPAAARPKVAARRAKPAATAHADATHADAALSAGSMFDTPLVEAPAATNAAMGTPEGW